MQNIPEDRNGFAVDDHGTIRESYFNAMIDTYNREQKITTKTGINHLPRISPAADKAPAGSRSSLWRARTHGAVPGKATTPMCSPNMSS